MKTANATFSLLIILMIFLVFLLRRWHEPARRPFFSRNINNISVSDYASCRMGCLQVGMKDVKELIKSGVLILNRRHVKGYPCPVHYIQGTTGNNRKLRLVVSQCSNEITLINCYTADSTFNCNCAVLQQKNI